jgi:hypothetical protein
VHSEQPVVPPSKKRVWAGRILTAIPVLFLLFDTIIHLLNIRPVVEGLAQLGYPSDLGPTLGVIQLVALVVYLVPRSALFGAILWTGYLGGAIATHVRVDNPLFSHVLFPVYVALLLWGGLYLRDRRLRSAVAAG